MFGRTFAQLLFSLLFFAAPATAQVRDLKITIEPAANSRYKISVGFQGDADGSNQINLPNEWGGQKELFNSLHNLTVSGESAKIVRTDDPRSRTVTHKPDEEIILSYEVGNGFEGRFRNDIRYRPVADKNFIHWIGNAVWAFPDWDDSTEVDVSIEWKHFPNDWSIANSFGSGSRKQRSKIRFGELRQSIFVGGDFRIVETKAGDNPVNVAIRGSWQFKDTELAEMIRKVIEVQRNFWNDHSQKYYLVTLVPIEEGPNASSFGGTGLTDSFALFATPNASIGKLRALIAHEYAHNWIPGKLGGMPAETEQALYWFSEGFTEFYTFRLLHREGLITTDELIGEYNERIREYYMSPVRTAANDRIVKEFWTDRDVQRLPYLRGFLFATNLDAEIRSRSAGKMSLDKVMLDLFEELKGSKKELSFESLSAAFSRYLGRNAMPLIKKFIIDGETIAPHGDALGESITVQAVEVPVFELGLDFDKFAKERVVSGVASGSSAYEAGLRNGQMREGGVSIFFGDISREVLLTVNDGGEVKTVKYFPVSKNAPRIPLYKLK